MNVAVATESKKGSQIFTSTNAIYMYVCVWALHIHFERESTVYIYIWCVAAKVPRKREMMKKNADKTIAYK